MFLVEAMQRSLALLFWEIQKNPKVNFSIYVASRSVVISHAVVFSQYANVHVEVIVFMRCHESMNQTASFIVECTI